MKITCISVEKLFNEYTYTIDLNRNQPISIIHAPNGYGKTTVFKMITCIFNLDINELYDIPFIEFYIDLNDGHRLLLKKVSMLNLAKNKNEDEDKDLNIKITKMNFSILLNGKQEYTLEVGPDDINSLERMHRYSQPITMRESVRYDVIKKYDELIDKITKIRESIDVNFIETGRLSVKNNSSNSSLINSISYYDSSCKNLYNHRSFTSSLEANERIVHYANNLQKKINQVKREYSNFSETKDRTFPNRLVDSVNNKSKPYDPETVQRKLDELEKKRTQLEEIGFISKETNNTFIPSLNSSDETLNRFYTLYIDDTFDKLDFYNDIKEKVELFYKIINTQTKFSKKKMEIDNDGKVLFISKHDETNTTRRVIQLKNLSSGEKHLFILLYELIFNSNQKSIFLIDEPEISLHIAWQIEFVKILEEIFKINGIQAIIATHSPDIVNGRDDLLISIGLEDEIYE